MERGKLRDYSGEFVPDITWDHFQRETLLEALRLYSNLFLAIDGFWYLSIKERFDDETAIDRDLWVWDKYLRYETKRLTKFLNITGNDVEAFLKITQLSAWSGNIKFKTDLLAKNHCVVHVEHCPTLEALVREGKGREQYFCDTVDRAMFEMQARALNPEISVRALRLPPATIGGQVCCQWEIKL